MRILFLSQRVPYPPDRGDKIPTYHYVRRLARDHDVTVTCLADRIADLANVDGLRPLVRDVEAVPVHPMRARVRAFAALAGERPMTVAHFDETALHQRVRRRVESGRFDAALVFSSGMAQYVEPYARLPRVIQFADLDSQKWQLYAAASRPPMRWLYRSEADRLLRYERRLASTFSRSLVCSPRERDDCARLIPDGRVECLPNGVDVNYFRHARGDKSANSLVFTGVMNYRPNVDAMVWFCHSVLPQVRAAVPDTTLTICGSSPNRAVRALEREPGVTVTGAVPDVRPYLERAAVGIVPLRMARGIQNKLLEAMAVGLPVVTTTAAWSGIKAEPGRDLCVADEADDFSDAVIALLGDRRRREQMGDAARAAVETHYTWDRTLDRLEAILLEVTAPKLAGVPVAC